MVEPEILFDFLPYLAHCFHESKRYLRKAFQTQIRLRSWLRRRVCLVFGDPREVTWASMDRKAQAFTMAGAREFAA